MAQDKAYRKAERCIEKARQEGAIELDLSNNQLTQVPEAIASLTQLQQLDLSNNQLTVLPEAIGFLTQLQELDLFFNQLTELAPDSDNRTLTDKKFWINSAKIQ